MGGGILADDLADGLWSQKQNLVLEALARLYPTHVYNVCRFPHSCQRPVVSIPFIPDSHRIVSSGWDETAIVGGALNDPFCTFLNDLFGTMSPAKLSHFRSSGMGPRFGECRVIPVTQLSFSRQIASGSELDPQEKQHVETKPKAATTLQQRLAI